MNILWRYAPDSLVYESKRIIFFEACEYECGGTKLAKYTFIALISCILSQVLIILKFNVIASGMNYSPLVKGGNKWDFKASIIKFPIESNKHLNYVLYVSFVSEKGCDTNTWWNFAWMHCVLRRYILLPLLPSKFVILQCDKFVHSFLIMHGNQTLIGLYNLENA